MNYDDWKSTEPDLGDRGHAPLTEPRRQPCRYCERGERQVLWPPEAPTCERCQVCGETRALRELTGAELVAELAAVMRQKG